MIFTHLIFFVEKYKMKLSFLLLILKNGRFIYDSKIEKLDLDLLGEGSAIQYHS